MLTYSVKKIQGIWHNYISLTEVQENNRLLNEEIKMLKNEIMEFAEQKMAHKRLTKMLEYKSASEKEMILASVIGADALGWSKMITINKGTNEGINKNMTVVSHDGLIGHVIQAVPNSSKVLLITDARSAVDALEQNERTRGVVIGKGSDLCEMKYISHEADIEVGDSVMSSGLGGVFPKGLLIGKVSQVDEIKKGLFKNVVITPAAKISLLEEVFVLK